MRAMLYSGMIGDFMARVLLVHPGIDVNVQDQVRHLRERMCICYRHQVDSQLKT